MTTFLDGDILHAGSLEAILARLAALEAKDVAQDAAMDTAAWWRGKMAATLAHTSGNYRSLGVTTKHSGEALDVGISGDCIVPPAGVYEVSASCTWPSNGTGYRAVGLMLNPDTTTRNSTTAPVGTLIDFVEFPAVSGSNQTLEMPRQTVRFNGTTDKLMAYAYQNSGSALTIPAGVHQVDVGLTRIGA